jgi:exonuclease VII small subunit
MHFRLGENKYPIMFNFTKKHGNTPVDMNEQGAGVSEKYNAAIKNIERLEGELNQKTQALNQSYKAQAIMNESVKNCVASLFIVQNQLQVVAAHSDRSNKRIFELIQKNKALESSGNEWFRRAIKLEFEVLMAKDELKKTEHERDSAVEMCELLRAELMSNNQNRKQG